MTAPLRRLVDGETITNDLVNAIIDAVNALAAPIGDQPATVIEPLPDPLAQSNTVDVTSTFGGPV